MSVWENPTKVCKDKLFIVLIPKLSNHLDEKKKINLNRVRECVRLYVRVTVYVCDDFLLVLWFLIPFVSIFLIVWIVRITHSVFYLCIFFFYDSPCPLGKPFLLYLTTNFALHQPAGPEHRTKQTWSPQNKTKSIKFGDGRSVGLTTMGAMSVTVSLNTNGVGLDSTLSAVPVPGPTAANGSSPTTIGAVTSSPATVGAAPAVASAASITSAGVLTPRADL